MLLLWACAHTVPPAPAGIATDLGQTVQLIVDRPTNRGRRVAVVKRAEDMGLAVDTEWIDWFSTQKNVIIELPGSQPQGDIVYLVAHYDKVDINLLTMVSRLVNGLLDPLIMWSFMTDGALDNATGVAVVLQLAAALAEQDHETTFRFLLAGHEEAGLRGTRAHVARLPHQEKQRIRLAVNIDTIGKQATANCIYEVSDPGWAAELREAAREEGVTWDSATIPGGATSDHVVFQKNSFARDFGRGCMFGGPGGLLPQRSWFTSPSSSPVLFVSSCEVLDIGDFIAGCCGIPTGSLHGPRDRADLVDPVSLEEVYRVLLRLLSQVD